MDQPPRILICGSRDYANYQKIRDFVFSLPTGTVIIEGEARGADKMSAQAAEEKGIPDERVLRFPADWTKYGRAAGFIRNRQMLCDGKPTHVAAFHDDIESSKGTQDMIAAAQREDVPVLLNPERWWDFDGQD